MPSHTSCPWTLSVDCFVQMLCDCRLSPVLCYVAVCSPYFLAIQLSCTRTTATSCWYAKPTMDVWSCNGLPKEWLKWQNKILMRMTALRRLLSVCFLVMIAEGCFCHIMNLHHDDRLWWSFTHVAFLKLSTYVPLSWHAVPPRHLPFWGSKRTSLRLHLSRFMLDIEKAGRFLKLDCSSLRILKEWPNCMKGNDIIYYMLAGI